jgi:hypothetical protein
MRCVLVLSMLLPAGIASAKEGMAQKSARGFGFAAGVAVTSALAISKKWNAPLRGPDGQREYIHVDGHRFELRARHAPVLGPKILDKARGMPTATAGERLRYHLVLGLGQGAAAAPPAEARMEATLATRLRR